MASPLIKFNGKSIQRANVEAWWLEGTTLNLQLTSGNVESEDMLTSATADEALGIMDNLTEMDDIDGLLV